MRSFVALALLVMFTMPLVRFQERTDSEAKLPPCCRKDGKHACGMLANKSQAPSSSNEVALRAAKSPCASYPSEKGTPATLSVLLAKPATDLGAPSCSITALVEMPRARYQLAFDRSHLKRGPPSLHSA